MENVLGTTFWSSDALMAKGEERGEMQEKCDLKIPSLAFLFILGLPVLLQLHDLIIEC